MKTMDTEWDILLFTSLNDGIQCVFLLDRGFTDGQREGCLFPDAGGVVAICRLVGHLLQWRHGKQ